MFFAFLKYENGFLNMRMYLVQAKTPYKLFFFLLSERARNTQSSKKKTMDEAKFINSSLMSLREAIKNLSQVCYMIFFY